MPDVHPDLEVLPPSEQFLENMINVNYNLIAGLEFAFVELALWASRSSIETAVVRGRLGRGVMFEVGRGGEFECGGEGDDRGVGDEGGLEGSVTSGARDGSDDARGVYGGGGLGGWV